jgi:hypothetical protein
LNSKAVLVLPKTAGSAQTHKSIGYILNCLEQSICISLLGSKKKRKKWRKRRRGSIQEAKLSALNDTIYVLA